MNSVLVAVVALGSFYMAYKVYGGYLAAKVFVVDPNRRTPAHQFKDDIDFVPTDKRVLWGHHFVSIAGAGPIVGPAIGVIWGWVPALLWVVCGTIFMGAVHDFGALIVSVRHEGNSIGDLTGGLIGKRSRLLFLLIILFLLWLVIAVFAFIIATLFHMYPATVIPTWLLMPLATFVGLAIYRFKWGVPIPAMIALVITYASIWVGVRYPVRLDALAVGPGHWASGLFGSDIMVWIWLICGYSLAASVLPVWVLLQPRDFISAEQLVVGMVLLCAGLVVAHPPIVAPAVQLNPAGAPPIFPFLFIVIACGAISGFHSLVSSGTSAKQLNSEADSQFIGYGAMVAEGIVAVMVVLACSAGFATHADWDAHYAAWDKAEGLGATLSAFVSGGQRFITSLGIPANLAEALLGVMVVSFAMTTIDTATRLQRYIIHELAKTSRFLSPLRNRYLGGFAAAGSALALVLLRGGGKGGLILWPVFGAANQLLGGLALVVITIWLLRNRRPALHTLVPMVIMLVLTSTALLLKFRDFVRQGDWLLAPVTAAILLLALWLVVEAAIAWRRARTGAMEAAPAAEQAAGAPGASSADPR